MKSLKKRPEKKPTPTSDFKKKIKDIEKDVEELIAKYRDPSIPIGSSVLTKVEIEDEEDMPKDGFYLVLISSKNDKVSLRQFGYDITPEAIFDGFAAVVKSIYGNKEDTIIGQG